MYGRDGKGRLTYRKKEKMETLKVNDQCKKDTIYSQGKQMDHASDLSHKDSIHTHTNKTIKAEDRNFSMSLFIQLIHFLCFIRDVIL